MLVVTTHFRISSKFNSGRRLFGTGIGIAQSRRVVAYAPRFTTLDQSQTTKLRPGWVMN